MSPNPVISDAEDSVATRKLHRDRFIKYSVIGLGVTVALFPAMYFLRRSTNQSYHIPWGNARVASRPPPRRVASQSSVSITNNEIGPAPIRPPGISVLLRGNKLDDEDSPLSISWSDLSRSSAWLTFKAFSLATLGVVAFAGTSISLLVWRWDVQDMQDFHDKMRWHISSILPGLSATMRRPLASVEGESAGAGSLSASIQEDDINAWTWDTAKERMDQAYERGGAPAWLAAVARELELERLQLLRIREEAERRRSNR